MLSRSRSLPNAWRRLSYVRGLCTSASEEPVKKARYRKKNLVEVASYLPDRGLGHKFTRLLWLRKGFEDSYWTVSKVVEKSKGRLRYYGRLTWRGNEDPREQPVRTWQKPGWRFILDGDKAVAKKSPGPPSSNTVQDAGPKTEQSI